LEGQKDHLLQLVGIGDHAVPNHAHAELILQGRSAPGQEFSLNQEEIIIGRDPSAHLVSPSPAISHRHARLYVQGGQYLVEDLEQQ
jgi:hypothetical protein